MSVAFPFKQTIGRYKGVSWNKFHERYTAQITIGGKQLNLGLFGSEVEAALAYNEAAEAVGMKFINKI